MKIDPEEELLLDEIFSSDPQFREVLLNRTVKNVRARRRARFAAKLAGSAVLLVAFTALLIFYLIPEPTPPLLVTQPNGPFLLVHTQPFDHGRIVQSESQPEIPVADSQSSDLRIVQTARTSIVFREIDTTQLLRLFADRPTGLIQINPNEQMLVLGASDANGFPVE